MPLHYHTLRRLHSLSVILSSGGLLLGVLLTGSPAQVTTAITPDGTLGTTVIRNGTLYDITGGRRPENGPNLFHSFNRFTVGTGDSARFSGPTEIKNILSRVTGGQQSLIDGRLQSTIPGANLYLLNPSGVVFGSNASLDINGSFHVSTADYLRFADGATFSAHLGAQSTLTVAPPAAFGFLTQNPAGIAMEGSRLQVPEGETISIVGGDVKVVGGRDTFSDPPNLSAPSGQIHIVSVASPGEVVLNASAQAPALHVDAFERLGRVALSEVALIDAGGDGGGTVVIRGGRLMLENSRIFASTKGPAQGPLQGAPGAGIDIRMTGEVLLDRSILGTNVFTNVAAGLGSGGIRVKADRLEMRHGAEIQSITFLNSTGGKSGDIAVDTNSVLVRDGSSLEASTGGAGDAGRIAVKTGSLELRDQGFIFINAFGGTGKGGNIDVEATSILLSNPNAAAGFSAITAQSERGATGKAGDVRVIAAESLHMLERTEISTPTFGPGPGGNVKVKAGSVSISGSSDPDVFTGIFANTFGSGNGGRLTLTAGSLEMTNNASIQAGTFFRSNIPMSGTGDAGGITIQVGSLELRDASFITTSALRGAGGNAGNLEVIATRVFISGPESSADPFAADFTGLTTESGRMGGRGGDLRVTADSLILTNRGSISSASFGPDRGGNIEVRASLNISQTVTLDIPE